MPPKPAILCAVVAGTHVLCTLGLLAGSPAADSPAGAPEPDPATPNRPAAVNAPASAPDFFVTEVAFGTSMGIMVANPRKLSKPYTDAGYPGFVRTQWTPFSVNGMLRINRHVPGFDFIRFTQARKDAAQGGVKTRLRSSLTEISYGYVVWSAAGLSFIPRAGLGLVDVEQHAQRSGDVDFDSSLSGVTSDSGPTLTLQKTSAVLDLGMSLSYLAQFGKKPRKPGLGAGIRIGLHVGALVQLFDFGKQGSAWKALGEPVTGAPDMRVDGFYLRVFIAPSTLHRSVRNNK